MIKTLNITTDTKPGFKISDIPGKDKDGNVTTVKKAELQLPAGVKNFTIINEDIEAGIIEYIDLDVKAKNDNAAFIAESKKTDTIEDAVIE